MNLANRVDQALKAAKAIRHAAELPAYLIFPSPEYDTYRAAVAAGELPSSPAVKCYAGFDPGCV